MCLSEPKAPSDMGVKRCIATTGYGSHHPHQRECKLARQTASRFSQRCSQLCLVCAFREQTLHWAIWQQLKSPSAGFEDVIKSHFRLRKAEIQATGDKWIADAKTHSTVVANRMQTFLDNAMALIPST